MPLIKIEMEYAFEKKKKKTKPKIESSISTVGFCLLDNKNLMKKKKEGGERREE